MSMSSARGKKRTAPAPRARWMSANDWQAAYDTRLERERQLDRRHDHDSNEATGNEPVAGDDARPTT
jgi:hypothetical protein